MSAGRFITFEGGEACGKSTQIQRLAERLRNSGRNVHVLREPGGTPLGEKVRNLLKHDPDGRGMASETELLLMNASRAELVRQVIRPALAAGGIVLCDRFFDSTTAYQTFGRQLDSDAVRAVIEFAVGTTRPDLTLLFQLNRSEALKRLSARQSSNAPVEDRFEQEKEAFFDRVEAGYRAVAAAEPERIKLIDAAGDIDSVSAQVWEHVGAVLRQ